MRNEVNLSEIKSVPKISKKQVEKLYNAGELSPFAKAALLFVSSYRGKDVSKFMSSLRGHMVNEIANGYVRRADGGYYSKDSITSLTKRALFYTSFAY
jgi:hypothetical protein